MDSNFLKYYNNELFFLREMGEEFAKANPQIAENLGLSHFTCADPYIERLLEGFAFMAARVHSKLDSEFPRFTQSLINNVFPSYYQPVPSASVVAFKPDYTHDSLASGALIPKGTLLKSKYRNENGTSIFFTTAHDVTLWPVAITGASLQVQHSDIPGGGAESALSIEISTVPSIKLSETAITHLDFYLSGASIKFLMDLYEQIRVGTLAVKFVFEDDARNSYEIELKDLRGQLVPLGFDDNQSLFPPDPRDRLGHRLLREYFAFPKRFLFLRLDNILDAVKQIKSGKARIVFLFKDANELLLNNVGKDVFTLFATPAANVFQKRLDRVVITDRKAEMQVVADKTKPLDYEVIQINNVQGYDRNNSRTIDFKPFYQTTPAFDGGSRSAGYYSIQRSLSTFQNAESTDTKGTELFVSILDADTLLDSQAVVELGIDANCSNRRLPRELPVGTKSRTDFETTTLLPIDGVKLLEIPTAPLYSHIENISEWQLINHLRFCYHSMIGFDVATNTEIMQSLMGLYADPAVPFQKFQISGLASVGAQSAMRMMAAGSNVSFVSGIRIQLLFNDLSFGDSGFLILSNILHRLVANSLPINSFIETSVCSSERGEVALWST